MVNLYKLSLECDGFVVDAFNDPLLVLSSYRAGIYDLLLIDIPLTELANLVQEAWQKQRESEQLKVIPEEILEEEEKRTNPIVY